LPGISGKQILASVHIGKQRYGRLIYTLQGDKFQRRLHF